MCDNDGDDGVVVVVNDGGDDDDDDDEDDEDELLLLLIGHVRSIWTPDINRHDRDGRPSHASVNLHYETFRFVHQQHQYQQQQLTKYVVSLS